MGGGGRYPYPKDVWSPAGGWWPHPRMWKRNTAIVTAGIIAICIPIFIWSEKNMVSFLEPYLSRRMQERVCK